MNSENNKKNFFSKVYFGELVLFSKMEFQIGKSYLKEMHQ